MPVCPSTRLSVHPSVRPPVCPSIRLSVHPSVRPPLCSSIRLSVHPSVRTPVSLSSCLCFLRSKSTIQSAHSIRETTSGTVRLQSVSLSVRLSVCVCRSPFVSHYDLFPSVFLSPSFLLDLLLFHFEMTFNSFNEGHQQFLVKRLKTILIDCFTADVQPGKQLTARIHLCLVNVFF